MPTFYERLEAYYAISNSEKLNYKDKARLGQKIAILYHDLYKNTKLYEKLSYTASIEDSGTYKVLQYPDFFQKEIDTQIINFFLSKRRKRKPIQKPAFSYKRRSWK